jgi:hypothetical protein
MDLPVEKGDEVCGRDRGEDDAGKSEECERGNGTWTRPVHGCDPPALRFVKGDALLTLPDGSTRRFPVKRRRDTILGLS